MTSASLDDRVRLEIYGHFLRKGRPPTVGEAARKLHEAEHEVGAAYRRLEAARVIVLAPGTLNVWMANPLSAVPTPFAVEAEDRFFWGNCIWDAFGVLAMLGCDGRVETGCGDCQEPIALNVVGGELEPTEEVAHFAVPAARWWENVGFT